MTGVALPATVDVLVAGSGAAGLVAALAAAEGGASVLVAEAGPAFGGTTALSGGRVWVPGNAHGAAAGRSDPPEAARRYIKATCPSADDALVDAFVETAPRMSEWIERATPHRFELCPDYPDYHPSLPGATLGGRTLDSAPFDTAVLGELAPLVLRGPASTPVTHGEWDRWRFAHRFDEALLARRDEQGIVTGGRALVATLLAACRDAGVVLAAEARVTRLRMEGGAVTGAELTRDAEPATVAARAVVLATGGFEWNAGMLEREVPVPVTGLGGPPTNVGDAVGIARDAGAALVGMAHGWMMPMVQLPGETLQGRPFFRSLVTERGLPRSIIVNAAGERFANESLPYNELVREFQRPGPGGFPNARGWLVFDEGFRERYALPGIRPDRPLPDWLARGETLGALARAAGFGGAALEATVAEWNAMCAAGRDARFARGESAYDRYYGDPALGECRNLGPLDSPPFYAIEVLPGTIGTKGGPRTDLDGRALRADGSPISGLYAAGNAAAGWLLDAYPAPGATLAVAMTFGYRAGRHTATIGATR
jgi:3-oxosteroid 1-dehydrogenase